MEYPNSVEFELCGSLALFSNILTRLCGEKTSYAVPTYEALKGALKRIYWKPTIEWVIDSVRVMNPIEYESHGVNMSFAPYGRSDKVSDIYRYRFLRNVRYQVRAHFVWNDKQVDMVQDHDEGKHFASALKAIECGGRLNVFFGTSECPAMVSPCIFGEGEGAYDNDGVRDLGRMYHGLIYPDEAYDEVTEGHIVRCFWDAKMVNGYIRFPAPKDCEEKEVIGDAKMRVFRNIQEKNGKKGE